MPFVFSLNANRAFRCVGEASSTFSPNTAQSAVKDISDRVAAALDTESTGDVSASIVQLMPELLKKWGFGGMVLKSFRFDAASDSSGAVFHEGMLEELAADFFNSPEVRKVIDIASGSGGGAVSLEDAVAKVTSSPSSSTAQSESARRVAVQVERLSCTLTSLSVLNRLLHCKQLVRNPPPMPSADEVSTTDVNKTFKYPLIRKMDIFLPGGVTVSDALREYVMLSDDTYSENLVRMLDEELSEGGAGDVPEDEAYGPDADLGEGRAYPLIGAKSRKEFLYHVFWRLVSGGSPLCQFEEDGIYYKMGAREMYKDLVCAGRRRAVDKASRPEIVIQTHVLAVKKVLTEEGKREIRIFPVSEDVHPSNINFAYLIVNPSRREVIFWYNAFKSF